MDWSTVISIISAVVEVDYTFPLQNTILLLNICYYGLNSNIFLSKIIKHHVYSMKIYMLSKYLMKSFHHASSTTYDI